MAAANPVSTPSPSSFSYAQAIKRSSSNPAAPQSSSSAEAAAPASTEEISTPGQSADVAMTDTKTLAPQAGSSVPSSDQADTTAANNSPAAAVHHKEETVQSSQSEHNAGFKEDDAASERRPASRRGSNARESPTSPTEEKAAKVEEPPVVLKEAPPPTVNFWAQRAHNQPKPIHAASPVVAATASNERPQQASNASNQSAKTARPSVNATPSNTVGTDTRSARSTRQKPPSVQDAVSWPTPETAQTQGEEGQRKKTQDRAEKVEQAAPAKPHGKNEWVAMPFTPSVKFNTPMPDTRGRGGRGGPRGGRGSTRGAFNPTRGGSSAAASNATATAAATDSPPGSSSRARSESSAAARSTSQPPKPIRQVSGNHVGPRDGGESDVRGRPSHAAGNHVAQEAAPEGTSLGPSHQRSVSPRSSTRTSPADTTQPPGKQQQQQQQQLSEQPEMPAEAAAGVRPRRKSGHAAPAAAGMLNGDHAPMNGFESFKSRSSYAERSTVRKADAGRAQEGFRDPAAPAHFRERGEGRPRGGKARNSHYAGPGHINTSQPYMNGFATSGAQSAKSSNFPSAAYGQLHTNGRGSYRSASRSASIPTEHSYPRFPPFAAEMGAFDQAAVPQMYPLAPGYAFVDPANPMINANLVATQIGYYFSQENLIKDIFLRKHMDSKGFVSLSLIAGFKRMRDLTADMTLVRNICIQNPQLELRQGRDGQDRVRTTDNPTLWVLAAEERDPAARNDGPEDSEIPQPHNGYSHHPHEGNRSPMMMMGGYMANGDFYQAPYAGYGQPFNPMPISSPVNGAAFSSPRPPAHNRFSMSAIDSRSHGMPQSSPPPPPAQNGSHKAPVDEHDAFPNERVADIFIPIKPKRHAHARSASHAGDAVQAEANGSSENAAEATNGADERRSRSPDAAGSSERDHYRKLAELRKTLTSSRSRSKPSRDHPDFQLFYLNNSSDEHSLASLPQGAATEPYDQVRERALQRRGEAASGVCPDELLVLYDFWSRFLVRNFNTQMYNDFRRFAHEDASIKSSTTGMSYLVEFYYHALKSKSAINASVAQHFIELVQNEDPGKDRPAFKQLRSAWRDGSTNVRNRKTVSQLLHKTLKTELDR